MSQPLRVLYVTPELAPWVKAGGLAEVSHDLPRALADCGADLRLLIPAFPALRAAFPDAREITRFTAPGGSLPAARLLEAGDSPRLLLLECDQYYARAGGPYGDEDGTDWPDNAQRFGLLGRIAAWLGTASSPLAWRPDVLHCHDWPAGLAPAYLRFEPDARAATLMSIHNLAYQGLFDRDLLASLGLPPEAFAPEGLEFHGRVSFLKAGLHYATRLATVSPSYAREILGQPLGFGLEGLLQHRAADLSGILNGIDTAVWDPARDPHLESNYDASRLDAKPANKAALQRELGLREDSAAPLLGMVTRLVEQKGADLLVAIAAELLRDGAQLAVLGRGTPAIEEAVRGLQERHPGAVAARIDFSERLAHRIEAGADLFLMPSRFEPCGLNQFYSMRYGTPPVVRRTGGLADSVVDATPDNLRAGTATGFAFDVATAEALLAAVRRALELYRDPLLWPQLQRSAMARDSGWGRAARDYLALYRAAVAARSQPAP